MSLTVKSLSAQLADDVLEIKVKDKFEQFGNCYVKIKRDARGMPFAFCQYEVRHTCAECLLASDIAIECRGRGKSHRLRPWHTDRRSYVPH